MTLTTITASVGFAVASVTAGQPIEDNLISSVDGYTLEPEGDGLGDGSGPLSGADLADLGGMDPSDMPDEMAQAEGYVQMFTSDDGASIALVLGVDVGSTESRGFLAGFEGAAESEGASKAPLFPDETGALGDIEFFELEMQGMSAAMTAFMAGDFGISVQVFEATDPEAVLAAMVRDQVALTPLTHGSESSASDDDNDPAEQAGRIVGVLLFLGALVGIPAYLITRSRRRQPAAAGWPHQPPGWPPATGYPQGPPPPGYAPPPGAPPGYGPGAGYPPGAEAPPANPPGTPPPPPPPPPSDPPESDGWSRPK